MAKAESSSKKGANKKSAAKKSPAKMSAAKNEAKVPAAEETATLEGSHLPATHGKIGVFGGPRDRGIKPEDKLALPTGKHFVFERVRSLNPKSFYCAMRWDYHIQGMSPEEGKRWWANKKLVVTNPENGVSVIVRAVDYGPHENTGLDIGVSPAAAEALGVEVGNEVDVAFADQKAPTGLVTKKDAEEE